MINQLAATIQRCQLTRLVTSALNCGGLGDSLTSGHEKHDMLEAQRLPREKNHNQQRRRKEVRYIVIGKNGSCCPRCGRPTQIRMHREIRSKQFHQPYYYSRWFYCTNANCKTTTYMQDEFKVWNDNPRGRKAATNKPKAKVAKRKAS